MPARLSVSANDRSTLVVTASFADENGDSVVPDTVTWSLLTPDGNVVNNRDAVVVTPAATIEIVLFGDDLAYSAGAQRVLLVEATYTSDAGSGLPLRDEVWFTIRNLVGVG